MCATLARAVRITLFFCFKACPLQFALPSAGCPSAPCPGVSSNSLVNSKPGDCDAAQVGLPHDRVYSLNNFIVVNYSCKIEISPNNKIHVFTLLGKFFCSWLLHHLNWACGWLLSLGESQRKGNKSLYLIFRCLYRYWCKAVNLKWYIPD